MFFVIYPTDPVDWQHAMFMLSYYSKIKISTFSNGTDANTAYMVVESQPTLEGEDDEFVLAEMNFQGNWLQYGEKLCPHCIDHAEHYDTCGHLAFSKPINSSAFDKLFE